MGTFNTAIKSNDTYADAYGDFFTMYDDGAEVQDITKRLITKYQSTIADPDDRNDFWFALAKAQWECRELDETILGKVRAIIDSGDDIERWKRLDATEVDIRKRTAALDKFLSELLSEKLKIRPRKKKRIVDPVFDKGDCIIFKLESGNYGGMVVLEAIYNTPYGNNLLAVTRINKAERPQISDFEKSEVLTLNFANWNNKQNIRWFNPLRFKDVAHLFEIIGNIKVDLTYDPNSIKYSFIGDLDIHIIDAANKQFEWETTHQKISGTTIKKLTRKNKWKFW